MKKWTVGRIFILLCVMLFLSACSKTPARETTAPPADEAIPQAYRTILDNIIAAHPWNDDDTSLVPENPELSYLYRRSENLSDIGFALVDLDHNGQKELIIADVNNSFIYDLYTISDGKAVHLAASGERFLSFLRENGLVENQWSGSAASGGHDYFKLKDGKLSLVERIVMDAHHALASGRISDLSEASEENTYFRSTSDRSEDYQPISYNDATKAMDGYKSENKPLTIEYTLLSEFKN